MEVNYKKTILNTTILTFVVFIVATVIFVTTMYFAFTKTLADLCYSMGCKNTAGNLYYRVYEKNDDIYYCYKALNIKILLQKDKDVVKYYKEFASDNEYNDFMNYLNESNDTLNISILEKSVILNEDNYLKRSFISSLIKTEREVEAFDYSLDYFDEYKNFDFYNQGVYVFNLFINDRGKFDIVYDNYDVKLINTIEDYFDRAYLIFENNKGCTSDIDKAYLMSLGNRLILVGEDLVSLHKDVDDAIISEVQEKMNAINDVLKGIL